MNFMNKMERKFGRYAIPNLMYYIVILYAVGVLVQMMAPTFYIQYLMLDTGRKSCIICYVLIHFIVEPANKPIL